MKLYLLFVLTLLCQLPQSPEGRIRPEINVDDRPNAIREALAGYDYAQAVILIDQALADTLSLTEESFRDLNLQKARCQKKLLRLQDACETLEQIAYSDDLEVMGELADSYVASGQTEKAVNTYNMLLLFHPENLYFTIQTASLLYKIGDFKSCIQLCRSISSQEENASIYSLIGGSFASMNQADSALVYYQKALELNPQKAGTVTSISNLLLQKKDYPAVISLTDSFLEENPGETSVKPILGLAYYLNKDTKNSHKVFDELYDSGDKSYGTCYYLGLSAYAERDYIRAVRAYEDAWQLDSTDAKLALNFAEALSTYPISRKHTALEMYDRAVRLSLPDSTIMYKSFIGKGYQLMRDERFAEAIAQIKTGDAYQPGGTYAMSLIGYCYRRMKDYKNAKIWYQRYLDVAKPGSETYKEILDELKFIDSELFMLE